MPTLDGDGVRELSVLTLADGTRVLTWAESNGRRTSLQIQLFPDGTRRYTDNTWPFAFHRTVGWDSTTVANGRHLLTVLAYGRHGYRTRKRVPVRVVNPPITLSAAGAVAGEAVAGELQLDVSASSPVERVTLYADLPHATLWRAQRVQKSPEAADPKTLQGSAQELIVEVHPTINLEGEFQAGGIQPGFQPDGAAELKLKGTVADGFEC